MKEPAAFEQPEGDRKLTIRAGLGLVVLGEFGLWGLLGLDFFGGAFQVEGQ